MLHPLSILYICCFIGFQEILLPVDFNLNLLLVTVAHLRVLAFCHGSCNMLTVTDLALSALGVLAVDRLEMMQTRMSFWTPDIPVSPGGGLLIIDDCCLIHYEITLVDEDMPA